jgi:predicted amidophosphoribosyltransferase
MAPYSSLHCPVCKARFRGQRMCPRCGADLSRLMLVAACAQRLRHRARQALCEGRYAEAQALADRAQTLQRTVHGYEIAQMARLLDMVSVQHK